MGLNYDEAVEIARSIKSEDGENPEYDRALLEFLWYAYSGASREAIAEKLEVNLSILYPTGAAEREVK